MPLNTFVGGGAYKAFYRISDAHDAIQNATTGVTVGAPTTSDAAFILKDDAANDIIVESSDFSFAEDGVGTFKFATNNQSAAFLSFLDKAAPLKAGAASTARAEKFSEAGLKIGGGSGGSDINYLVISAGADDGTNRLTDIAIVTLKRTSYSTSHKYNEDVMVALEATTVACVNASGFAAVQGLFDAAYFGATIPAGDRTIPLDYYAIRKLIPLV